MLKLVLTSALALLLSGGPTANAKEHRVTVARGCPEIVTGVYFYRHQTHKWETKLHRDWSKSQFNASLVTSCKYTVWVAHKWMHKAHKRHTEWIKYQKDHQQKRALLTVSYSDPVQAICYTFGPYCQQALAVARCESGYSVYASNGQYLGLFQMGSSERATYGHGPTAIEQARAAYRYFIASGSNWGPWSCKPW